MRRPPPTTLAALTWLTVLAVSLLQHTLVRVLDGRAPDPLAGVRAYGPFLLAWAVATPLIWRAAARWPVRGAAWSVNALRHAGVGVLFFVMTNTLVRLPLLAADAGTFLGDLGDGLVRYGPSAALGWAGLVALGHALGRRRANPLVIGGSTTVVLAPDDIVWIEARDNYVRVHGTSGPRLVRTPISALEASLDPVRFVRVHRSAIIAVDAIREVRPAASGGRTVTLSTGATLRVPRPRRAALERVLAIYRTAPGRNSAAR